MPLNQIKSVLAAHRMDAKDLLPILKDCPSAACMSYITQGYVNMTKADLQSVCEFLGVKPSDIYSMKDLDYSALVTPRRPKIAQEDNRDRTAEFSATFANKDAKDDFHRMIADLGYETWQAWFMAVVGITQYMHVDLMKMKER